MKRCIGGLLVSSLGDLGLIGIKVYPNRDSIVDIDPYGHRAEGIIVSRLGYIGILIGRIGF